MRFNIFRNHPNPCNPTTLIQIALPEQAHVTLAVYDMRGRKVAPLVDEQLSAGWYSGVFDASHPTTGMYIYHLKAIRYPKTKRLMLIKYDVT